MTVFDALDFSTYEPSSRKIFQDSWDATLGTLSETFHKAENVEALHYLVKAHFVQATQPTVAEGIFPRSQLLLHRIETVYVLNTHTISKNFSDSSIEMTAPFFITLHESNPAYPNDMKGSAITFHNNFTGQYPLEFRFYQNEKGAVTSHLTAYPENQRATFKINVETDQPV